jgi:hypothetical protein
MFEFLVALAVEAAVPSPNAQPFPVYLQFEQLCNGASLEEIVANAQKAGWTSFKPVEGMPIDSLVGGMYGAMNAGNPSPVKSAFYFSERAGSRLELMVLVDDKDQDGKPESLTCHLLDFEQTTPPDEKEWSIWAGSAPIVSVSPESQDQNDEIWGTQKRFLWRKGFRESLENLLVSYTGPTEFLRSIGLSGLHIITFRNLIPDHEQLKD